MLLFQPSSSTSAASHALANTGEASLDKVEFSENKTASNSSSLVTLTSDAGGSRDSAGLQDDRERLTFHVALGESGFASLGISVTKVFRNRRDCGIFIKSVRIGGMAAKVCEPMIPYFSSTFNGMALNSLHCAEVPLSNCSPTHGHLKYL